MNYSHKLSILLMIVLLSASKVQNAAETTPATGSTVATEAATEVTVEEKEAEEKEPVEVDPADTTEAGEAKHAFKEANVCEGMAEGSFLGPDVCADCHQDKIETLKVSPHGQSADKRAPFGKEGCEQCHGPGELHFDTEGNCIISMTGRYGESVEQRNKVCLDCHKSGDRMHWFGSLHESEDIACVSCHSIHKHNDVIERTTQAEVCYTCHKDIRADTFRASSHPIRENKVTCSDCHNPHGSAGPKSLKHFTINETCYSCHAEKRGPFLWEHYPASEDCTLCHRVHGSNHAALLNKQGPQLCQQCHADIRTAGGGRHIRNFLDFDDADPGRARFKVVRNCANCHIKVHGSNHPSGAALQR